MNTKIKLLLQHKSVYETLKHIENNFEKICEQVDFLLENRPNKPIEYQETPNEQNSEKKEEDSSEEDEKHHKKEKEIKPDIELNTLVSVQKLDLNCEILVVEDILLHLVCDCSNAITYVLRSKQRRGLTIKAKIRCPKCKEVLIIFMTRVMVGKSGIDVLLGRIGVAGGDVEEVGGVSWKVICPCENFVFSGDLTLSGVRRQLNCFTCFHQYSILYYGLFRENAFTGDAAQKQALKFDKGKDGGYKLDTELPNRGTCKHSKFSYRFFRYPCCGRAFPCETCHEEKTVAHPLVAKADVMICGFCSW